MKLVARQFLRGFTSSLAVEVAAAYLISHFFLPTEPFAFFIVLACIFALDLLWMFKAWGAKTLSMVWARSDIKESFRRQLVDSKIPAPEGWDQDAVEYLVSVADDQRHDTEKRIAAGMMAARLAFEQSVYGLTAGFFISSAASDALNQLKRDKQSA